MKIIKRSKFHLLPNYSESDVVNEITMLRRLDHPNIIKLKDFFKTDQAIYIVGISFISAFSGGQVIRVLLSSTLTLGDGVDEGRRALRPNRELWAI